MHKCIDWIVYLDSFLDCSSISHKDLLSLIGKLDNVVTILKMMGHFMNNIYSLDQKAEVAFPHSVKIQRRAKEDVKLHKIFLQKSQKGISMNLLTFRKPTHTTIGYACQYGLGDFHVESGVGWR